MNEEKNNVDGGPTIKKNEHTIYCIECGTPRVVTAQNWKQVVRCEKHQYLKKRKYNSQFIKKQREKLHDGGDIKDLVGRGDQKNDEEVVASDSPVAGENGVQGCPEKGNS